MSETNASSAAERGAGVLELLRLFKSDNAAADRYAPVCLEKTKAVEPVLRAFEYLPRDTSRRPGPLSGIPVAIKDIIATADMPTTNGSPIYKDVVPTADAWIVERLRNLGATIFGKTVSTEFAWRRPGPTVNPWNRNHTPGGSSSGSAAAVAAGLVPPRLGIVRFTNWSRAEPEQQQVFEAAIAKLRDTGAILEELELASLDQTNWSAINTILTSEGAFIFSKLVERYPDRSSDHLKSLVQTGKSHGATDYLAAKVAQEKLRFELASSITGFDAVLTLPAFGEAPQGPSYTGDAEYCAPWTLLGVPAISLPAGLGKNGLPLGLQVVGAYRQDHRTLRVAKWIENALEFNPGIPKI